jgi:hypothetical protein
MIGAYKIEGQNDNALVNANFDSICRLLAEDRQWGTHVLQMANTNAVSVAFSKAYGSVLGSSVIRAGPGYMLIKGTAGKRNRLLYRLEALDGAITRITPEGRADGYFRVIVPVGLLCMGILPVVLTPLLYKLRAHNMRYFSARHLSAFCRYLGAGLQTLQEQQPQPQPFSQERSPDVPPGDRESESASSLFCGTCGKRNLVESKFCYACGGPIISHREKHSEIPANQ